MKKLFYLVLLFLFVYTCYNLLIKTTHFVGEKTSFVYHKTGLSDLADTLVAKKIIFDKPSFLAFAKILKVEDKLKPGKFLVLKNKKPCAFYAQGFFNLQNKINLFS